MDIFSDIAAVLCAPGPHGGLGSVPLAALFLAGLGGGVMHCAPMCGPFVLGQVGDGLARLPAGKLCEMHRLSHAMLAPYHLGRLATYMGLGALAASAGAGLGMFIWPAGLRAALLALAALLFLGLALRGIAPSRARYFQGRDILGVAAGRALARAAGLVTGPWHVGGFRGRFLRGVLLGFLPCGMLYTVLVLAAATAHPVAGALAMLAFGLGTVPALLIVGLAGHAAGRRWGRGAAMLSPVLLVLNAALLGLLAWNLS